MSDADWACAACESHNTAQDGACRICGEPRVAAATAVRRPARPAHRSFAQRRRPEFVESRHTGDGAGNGTTRWRYGSRPEPPAPPPPRPAPVVAVPAYRPAPARPRPRGPRPGRRPRSTFRPARRRSRAGRRLLRWLLVVAAFVFVVNQLGKLGTSVLDGISQGPDGSGVACPAEAAMWLPGGGDGAVLEASFVSPRNVITLCRTKEGELFYDGRFKGQPVNSTTHMSVLAEPTETGYTATNGDYKYVITGLEVIVTAEGEPPSRQQLTRTGP